MSVLLAIWQEGLQEIVDVIIAACKRLQDMEIKGFNIQSNISRTKF